MTTPEPTTVPTTAIDRSDLIEALSWTDDMEHGRWGTAHATAVLDAYDARVHADLLTELQRVRTYAALSWPSDTEDGRWGTKYATAVLDEHDAHVHAGLLAELEELRAYAATAHGPEAWSSAMEEMLRLREEVAAVQKAAAVAAQDVEARIRSVIAAELKVRADGAVERRDDWSSRSTGSLTSRDRIAHFDGYACGMRDAAALIEAPQSKQTPKQES